MVPPALARRERIESLLRERLSARHVEVIDESHLHAGHAGAAGGAGHFRALVVSPLSRARAWSSASASSTARSPR